MAKKPEKATRKLAMLAKCHDCTGGYADGKYDCENPKCPLYQWMPYASSMPDEEWLKYNPKMKGQVTWEESGREMSEEERAAAAERLAKARGKKSSRDELMALINDDD